MCNYHISNNKTMFDIFNMINPNCYQAFIIKSIIENRKQEAIKYCDELSVAFEYYKWDTSPKQSNYIDALICESDLKKWQKIAIIHIIANDIKECKSILENELQSEKDEELKRNESIRQYGINQKDLLYKMFGFDSLL